MSEVVSIPNLFNTSYYTEDVEKMCKYDLVYACSRFSGALSSHWTIRSLNDYHNWLGNQDVKFLKEKLFHDRLRYAKVYGEFKTDIGSSKIPSHKKMKRMYATWNAYSDFAIPDDVYAYLLPEPYGADTEAIGRWYIRYNTLYYNDKEGRTQEIQGTKIEVDEGGCKIPQSITNDEDEVVYED